MKSVSVLILLIVICACNCETTIYENGVSGGDLLYRGNSRSKSSWEDSWQSRKVRYPVLGVYAVPIGYLKIVNNIDSDYSNATVVSGGVTSKYVYIEYKSPAYYGYDYNVEIRRKKL